MKYFFITTLFLSAFFMGCSGQKEISNTNNKEIMKNKQAIEAFYGKALTVNNEARPTDVLKPLLSSAFESMSSSGSKNAAQLMQQLEFFWKIIPDLKWEPQAIINEGDTYVVRSIASGTPNGEFMGMATDGSKSFEIMTIDIHSMKDGQFLNTKHVEDWATSMKQLAGPKKQSAMEIADAFMTAMGKGDMEAMKNLMHEEMVWQNAGDKNIPWIGPWEGKKIILEEFLPAFGAGFQTIKWEPVDALTSDDTAAYFGQMIGKLTNSGKETSEFTYALRVKVKDDKVILWNWLEDSFEVSRAYNN